MNAQFWNERYGEEGLAYGERPNEFLVHGVEYLRESGIITMDNPRILCLAEGEGRNAFFLSGVFPEATIIAVDYSDVAVEKISKGCLDRGIKNIKAIQADLANYDLSQEGPYDLIVSIFAHLPSPLRINLHSTVPTIMNSGAAFLIEGYTVSNLGRGTGGPQVADFCYSKEILEKELAGLNVLQCTEEEKEVNEGKYHKGLAAVCNGLFTKS